MHSVKSLIDIEMNITFTCFCLRMHNVLLLLLLFTITIANAQVVSIYDSLANEMPEKTIIFKNKKTCLEKPQYVIYSKSTLLDLFFEERKIKNICSCKSLLYLDVIKRKFLINDDLNKISNLKWLFVSVKKLKVSPNFKGFSNLIFLQLDVEYLKDMPDFIYNTTSLLSLNINLYDETAITDSILKLKKLENLSITFHKLYCIPKQIYLLKNLKILRVYLRVEDGINIDVDESIVSLSSIESLTLPIDLNKKNIKILSQLKKLKELQVNFCTANDLLALSHLEEIIIEKNNIEEKKVWELNKTLPKPIVKRK